MAKKSFHIVMDEAVHDQLKRRAKDYCGLTIGDFVKKLLNSSIQIVKCNHKFIVVPKSDHDMMAVQECMICGYRP